MVTQDTRILPSVTDGQTLQFGPCHVLAPLAPQTARPDPVGGLVSSARSPPTRAPIAPRAPSRANSTHDDFARHNEHAERGVALADDKLALFHLHEAEDLWVREARPENGIDAGHEPEPAQQFGQDLLVRVGPRARFRAQRLPQQVALCQEEVEKRSSSLDPSVQGAGHTHGPLRIAHLAPHTLGLGYRGGAIGGGGGSALHGSSFRERGPHRGRAVKAVIVHCMVGFCGGHPLCFVNPRGGVILTLMEALEAA